MIKFFRKIRKKLLTNNKFSKYLLYAIGEIVLVVIGILIALGVNQKNQQKANNTKVDAIFEVILSDLAADIEESTEIINTIHFIDSVSHKILSDSIQYSYTFDELFDIDAAGIMVFTNLFNFTEGGYLNLTQNLDIIPQKYDSILKDLHYQYNAIKESVKYWNNEVTRLSKQNEDFLSNTFNWYYNPSLYASKINELTSHPKYKNSLYQYQQNHINWLGHVNRYRTSCINNYQKIATLLNKPIIHDSFKIEDAIANLFIGEWKHITEPDLPNEIFSLIDGRLFRQEKENDELLEEMFITSTKFTNSVKEIGTIHSRYFAFNQFKNDTITVSINNALDKTMTTFKMIKIKKTND